MININKLYQNNPYSMSLKEKNFFFKKNFNKLTLHHYKKSKNYKKILKYFNYNPKKIIEINKIPFIPIRLFKEFDMISTNKKNIIKTLLSSGTTGDKRSKIFLDKLTGISTLISIYISPLLLCFKIDIPFPLSLKF